MDITSAISLTMDLLTRADWAAYNNWEEVSRILNWIIPEAARNYQP